MQSRSQSPRSPYSAERGTRDSGIIHFIVTGFLSSAQLRRLELIWEMAAETQISEAIFREAIRFSLGKLGQPEQELK